MRLVPLLLCFAIVVPSAFARGFQSADIYLATSSNGKTIYDDARHFAVRDAKQVSTLAGFFPGLGGPVGRARPAAGWRSWGWVTFHQRDQKDATVYFARDGKTWSLQGTPGDHSTKRGLRVFLIHLTEK